jgi:hypothetical protein
MASKKKPTKDLLDIIQVAGGRKKRPPKSEKDKKLRETLRARMKNDPRFRVNLGSGNEFANNQPGDYENGVKVRNRKKNNNQFTAPRGLKMYNANEVKKFLDHEAPAEFCDKAGLPTDAGHTIGDCFLWANAREMLLSGDPYRRDKATDMILRLAAVAQEEVNKGNATQNVGLLNAPRITNIHFVDSPRDKRLEEENKASEPTTIDVKS